MRPRVWLEDKSTVYIGLLAGSTLGVVLLVSYTVLAIVGVSFEPIDPTVIAALTTILAVLAGEKAKSNGNANGE